MAKFIQVMQLLLELKGEDHKILEEDFAALKVWSINLVLSPSAVGIISCMWKEDGN